MSYSELPVMYSHDGVFYLVIEALGIWIFRVVANFQVAAIDLLVNNRLLWKMLSYLGIPHRS